MTTSMKTASCNNNNNNYFSAIFKRQSLAPVRTANRVEQSIYKSRNNAPQPSTLNSLRSLVSNSSHSSKNINVNRKEQPVSKDPITSVQKSGTFSIVNPKKRFREDENSKNSKIRNSAENNSRLTNLNKRSKPHDFVQKYDSRVVENSRKNFTIHNSNNAENNSRSVNPKNRIIEAESLNKCSKLQNSIQRSSTHTSNPNKRFRKAEGLTTHNFRTANLKKCSREVESSNKCSTVHNVQRNERNGTVCTSCLVNRSKEAEDSRKRRASLRIGFDQFSCKALSSRAKNKDLNKCEWEDIRLIKAALINFVDAHEEFSKIKIGKLVWSKINAWVYSAFYPEFIKYLDKKHINRENLELVIKAIMDYYVSRHDGYGRRLKKEIEEKRIYALMYKRNK